MRDIDIYRMAAFIHRMALEDGLKRSYTIYERMVARMDEQIKDLKEHLVDLNTIYGGKNNE